TLWTFVAMGCAALLAVHFGDRHEFAGFLLSFCILFVTTGVGNGATFRMIPVIFRNRRMREVAGADRVAQEAAAKAARIESATVLGFVSAIGACGGYLVPRALGASIHATGSAHAAFTAFVLFYVTCFAATWVFYVRAQRPTTALVPSVEGGGM